MSAHPSRRQILRSGLVSSSLGLAIGYPALTFAQSAAPTPQCHDADEATIRQTEGPYFKPSSPQRADLVEPETKARLVEINGQVLTRSCRPVDRALVALWHAPANRRDGLFRRDLAMRITEAPDGLAARFDFVLDMR